MVSWSLWSVMVRLCHESTTLLKSCLKMITGELPVPLMDRISLSESSGRPSTRRTSGTFAASVGTT